MSGGKLHLGAKRFQRYVIRDANTGEQVSEHRHPGTAYAALVKLAAVTRATQADCPRTFVLADRSLGTERPSARVTRSLVGPTVEVWRPEPMGMRDGPKRAGWQLSTLNELEARAARRFG